MAEAATFSNVDPGKAITDPQNLAGAGSEYPKHLHAETGEYLSVQNAEEEAAARAAGWMVQPVRNVDGSPFHRDKPIAAPTGWVEPIDVEKEAMAARIAELEAALAVKADDAEKPKKAKKGDE